MMRLFCQTILLLAFCAPLWAQNDPVEGQVHVVTAVGRGSIYKDNVARARDEAIADARVRAVESLGFLFDSKTTVLRGRLMNQTLQSWTRGYIVSDRVVGEGRNADIPELYEVKLEAWIKLSLSQADSARILRKFAVVLDVLDEVRHEGETAYRPSDSRTVQDALRSMLIEEGYEVYTRGQLQHLPDVDAAMAGVRQGDGASVKQALDAVFGELAVGGTVKVRFSSKGPETEVPFQGKVRDYCYYARPKVSVWKVRSIGGGISAYPMAEYRRSEDFKAFALSAEKAQETAAGKAAEPAVQKLRQALRAYAGSNEITVTVAIRGLPDVSKYRLYERLLNGLRWKKQVVADDFRIGGVSTYEVTYRESFFLLLSELSRVPGCDRVQGSAMRITMDYTGLP